MKTLLLAIVSLSCSLAFGQNQQALKLENLQLEIAQTLGTTYQQDGPCGGEVEAYTSEIANAVDQARHYFDLNWDYNKATGRKFTIHPDVTKTLSSTLFLKSIMNMLDHNDPSTYERALNRVIMWGPAPGVYGNMNYYKFGANNKIEFWQLELLNEDPWFKWNKTEGTFKVEINSWYVDVIITIDSQTESFRLKRQYQYDFNMWYMVPSHTPEANPHFDGFVDFPSECSA